MKTLAIIFPGIGYNSHKPLLYYTAKAFEKRGYTVAKVNYDNIDTKEINNCIKNKDILGEKVFHDGIFRFLSKALPDVEKQLSEYILSDYEQIIMVGKSIGAVIGWAYLNKHNIEAMNVLITPLELCFQFLKQSDGIVYIGENDTLVNKNIIIEECKNRDMEYHVYEEANHSLETKDIQDKYKVSGLLRTADNRLYRCISRECL